MSASSSPQRVYRLRRRLLLVISLLVALVVASGAATVLTALASRSAIQRAHDLEVASRRAALLSVVAREQYIHEAHTIILRDRSHVEHHDAWVHRLGAELDDLRPDIDAAGAAKLDEIGRSSRDLTEIFSTAILPAIDRQDWDEVHRAHERANVLVDRMTDDADALAGYFDDRAVQAEQEGQRFVRLALVLSIIVGALAVTLALVAGRSLWRSFSTPLGALERVAERVAAGDRKARIAPVAAVELTVVADAFNRMLDATALILGETGTGKELVARAIHERSSRAGARPIAINCAAIPRPLIESELFGHARGSFTGATADRAGLFEEASGSTLFLDEIGELRPTVQAKLTRVLEERVVRRIGEARERKIDVRVVAATHRDLRAMVKAGSFREDLWFRLNVCVIQLPPLRERPEDIPLLGCRFLAERAPQGRSFATRFSAAAMNALQAYRWPGNVRELRSAVERAVIVEDTGEIRLESLPAELQGASPLRLSSASDIDLAQLSYREAVDASREETNRRYLEAVLRRFRGDVAAAATHAGVERESFYRLLRRCGLSAEDFREDRRSTDGLKN